MARLLVTGEHGTEATLPLALNSQEHTHTHTSAPVPTHVSPLKHHRCVALAFAFGQVVHNKINLPALIFSFFVPPSHSSPLSLPFHIFETTFRLINLSFISCRTIYHRASAMLRMPWVFHCNKPHMPLCRNHSPTPRSSPTLPFHNTHQCNRNTSLHPQ